CDGYCCFRWQDARAWHHGSAPSSPIRPCSSRWIPTPTCRSNRFAKSPRGQLSAARAWAAPAPAVDVTKGDAMRLTWLALLIVACGDNAPPQPPTPDEYIVNCDTASDAGSFASDENYTAFLNKESANAVVKDCTKAPQLTSPPAGTVLDPAAPPTISFNDTPA